LVWFVWTAWFGVDRIFWYGQKDLVGIMMVWYGLIWFSMVCMAIMDRMVFGMDNNGLVCFVRLVWPGWFGMDWYRDNG
jgi:hypothetical protein